MKLKLIRHDVRGSVSVESALTMPLFLSLTFGLAQASFSSVQIDVLLRYQFVNGLALAIGARYWKLDTGFARAFKITMEKLASLSHLEISSAHHSTDFVDGALSRKRLVRRVTLRAPFLSAVQILAASDSVCVLPRRIARELITDRPLVTRPLPFSSPSIEIAMIWPRWFDNQSAHRWLRQNVEAAVNDLPP